jgi:hypothetical protein
MLNWNHALNSPAISVPGNMEHKTISLKEQFDKGFN